MLAIRQNTNTIRFRRFSRKGFAAFASIHREVTIGRLSAYMTDLQMKKSHRAVAPMAAASRQRESLDNDTDVSLHAIENETAAETCFVDQYDACASVLDCKKFVNDRLPYSNDRRPFCFVRHGDLRVVALVLLLLINGVSMAQDTVSVRKDMQEVKVTAKRSADHVEHLQIVRVLSAEEIHTLPVSTLGNLLDHLPGIDLRSRGADDVQSDLSVRGGTFDQVLVLLNGVNITDPHTGHYSMDLPIDMSAVERIELLQGAGLEYFGLSTFCGAINIVTTQQDSSRLKLGVAGGSYGKGRIHLNLMQEVGAWQFSGTAAYNRSDGYMRNTDYMRGDVFLRARRDNGDGATWDLQAGFQTKDYGAYAFYSLAYPDQYERTRTLLASASRHRRWDNMAVDYSLFGRWHYDCFELFRDGMTVAPAWYGGHNYHISGVEGGNVKMSVPWRGGHTVAGLELRNEHIVSTVLGDSLATLVHVPFADESTFFEYGKTRINGVAFLQHYLYWRRLTTSAGVSVNGNSMFGTGFCFSANAEWRLDDSWRATGRLGRSLRMPTFTDLYYHSAIQEANAALHPEVGTFGEMSVHYDHDSWHANMTVYGRRGENVIDWIQKPGDTLWRSANHTEVNAVGIEMSVAYTPDSWLRNAEVNYAFCRLDKEAGAYLSKYALDYLRHKMNMAISLRLARHLTADWQLCYQQRHGSYMDADGNATDYAPVWLLNGRVSYRLHHATIYVEGSNLLNRVYFDYGGIRQPGVMLTGGIEIVVK